VLETHLDNMVSYNRKNLEWLSAEDKKTAVELNDPKEYFRLRDDMFHELRTVLPQAMDDPVYAHNLIEEIKAKFQSLIEAYSGLGALELVPIEREVLPADFNERVQRVGEREQQVEEAYASVDSIQRLCRESVGHLMRVKTDLESRLEERATANRTAAGQLPQETQLELYGQNDVQAYRQLRADIAREVQTIADEYGESEEFNVQIETRLNSLLERVQSYDGLGDVVVFTQQVPAVQVPPAVDPVPTPVVERHEEPALQRTYSPRVQRELADLNRRLEYTESQHSAGRLNERAYTNMRDSLRERIRVLQNE